MKSTATKSEGERDAHAVMCLAVGRIGRILSRPFEAGDVEAYEAARRAFLDAHEAGKAS